MVFNDVFLKDIASLVAKLMAASAKTAPKARGINNVRTIILTDREELEKLAKKMEELASKYGGFYARDAKNIRESDAIVIIGCKMVKYRIVQPEVWKISVDDVLSLLNLGIAIGSAVKTASIHNVDNRVMMSAGVAAQELGLIDADIAMAIPLSIKGKNIFFDRRLVTT